MILTMKRRIRGVSLIFACGTALFSDGLYLLYGLFITANLERKLGYANTNMSSVNILLSRIYGADKIQSSQYSTILSSLVFAGTIVGMILFGWLSDKIGRKFGMMSATVIVAVFSVLSAVSSGANGSLNGMLIMLSIMRFMLGIGVGAEYPCGSVAAAEQSEESNISKHAQHRWVALATNNMISWGITFAAFVPLVLYWIFGDNHLRAIWRLTLGLGAAPAIVVFLWRLNMDEPERYKKDSMKRTRIPYKLVLRRYWVSLSAVSAVWFFFDFIVYPFNVYSATILDNITGGSNSLIKIFGWNTVINLSKVPGATIGAFFLDNLGPKRTLIIALILQAIVGFLMSAFYIPLTRNIAAFVAVYGVFFSLGAAGPGNCTIVLAAKTSSTAVRGQYYGVAAAVGKLGAFVGTWAFPPIIRAFGGPKTTRGNTGPFWIASGLSLLCALITLFWVHPLTRDGLVEEDRAFRDYLEAHGYDTSMMGLDDTGTSTSTEVSQEEKSDSSLEKIEKA